MKEITLNKAERILLEQVLNLPFGDDDLVQETRLGKGRIREIIELVQSHLKEKNEVHISIADSDLQDLINIYRVSCDILDPIELPTITGYRWEESQVLLEKLKKVLQ
jgi:hypothetical protein